MKGRSTCDELQIVLTTQETKSKTLRCGNQAKEQSKSCDSLCIGPEFQRRHAALRCVGMCFDNRSLMMYPFRLSIKTHVEPVRSSYTIRIKMNANQKSNKLAKEKKEKKTSS